MKMNDKFFPELVRRLKREGISTGPVEKGCLTVLADGRAAVLVMPQGGVVFNADVERGPEADSVYDLTFRLSREVYEYTGAMASAPPLVAEGLHEGFRVLADFNGVMLAGQELEANWGYKFATWRRSPDRTAVGSGEYFDGGHFYGAAKLDFACRAGLVDGHRQFTDQQLVELYRCVCETLESGYPWGDGFCVRFLRWSCPLRTAAQSWHSPPRPMPCWTRWRNWSWRTARRPGGKSSVCPAAAASPRIWIRAAHCPS